LTDHVAMAVGTTQGLFIASDGRVDGPFFRGDFVPAFAVAAGRYVGATLNARTGATVRSSVDAGSSWTDADPSVLAFPHDVDAALAQVCQLHHSPHAAGVVLAGTEPPALFRSTDGGQSFELLRSLWDHPHRPDWRSGPGCGGLHTVLTHRARPDRVIVALSWGGVYRSDNGGASWRPCNVGIALPNGEAWADHGQCVHKVDVDAADPDALWAQGHDGVYHSSDAGDSWVEVGRAGEDAGLPSTFGFPILAHPTWPNTAYVFPLESEEYRCSAGARCRVYRTTDGGATWEPLSAGLPQEQAHVTVLRDAFTASTADPCMLVFGTTSGEIYASADDGGSWRLTVRHLPPIIAVRVIGP
jgi:hypothetical protein